MPFVDVDSSPLLPGVQPVSVFYRDFGTGRPLVFLHGGWGYEVYPFDRQIEALADRFRIVIPDRTGYGRSGRLSSLGPDFHHHAANETLALVDELGLERPVLWGHSDGAVIAILLGRQKPGSRAFFDEMMRDPDGLGDRVAAVLAREHGETDWRPLIRLNGMAWLRIADESPRPDADLYDGRLSRLQVPALVLHGARDPRTEPGELDQMMRHLPRARLAILEEGGHSPHSERAVADEATRVAVEFLGQLA